MKWFKRLLAQSKIVFLNSKRLSIFALISIGIFAGVSGVIGFEVGMGMTNTQEFCSGCHLQPGATTETYYLSSHYKNKTGVRPLCSDCHVPVEFGNKMWRKILASREVWSHFSGNLDTTEKYLQNVSHMRNREIARMKANDSQECRNCHKVSNWRTELQTEKAQEFHASMNENGKTCIDCHQGLTHLSPLVEEQLLKDEENPENNTSH